jgi:uncharacterized SAM-dependent methyltransferase
MSFLQDSIDLFTGTRVAHMGMHQYVDHAGVCDGKSMSGAKLWADADAGREAEAQTGRSNLVCAEQVLLHKVASEIGYYLPPGLHVVELGPGTVSAFKNKTFPIINALMSTECTLVDGSVAFLKDIIAADLSRGITITSVEDDFWEGRNTYFNSEDPGLLCMFGSSVTNIITPLSDELPENALIAGLTSLVQAVRKGWMLVSFYADQDGERLKAYYAKLASFQLNILYRMAVELPISENFDPRAFDYEVEWRPRSSQLGHVAVVKRDIHFTLAGRNFFLYKGQRFHLKNAYKFRPEFFEACCTRVGLNVVKAWSDHSSAKVYLLKKPPQLIAQTASQYYPKAG